MVNLVETSLEFSNPKERMHHVLGFDMSQVNQWQGSEWYYNPETQTISFSSSEQYRGGIEIPETFFEIGKTYTLRFDMRKTSGDILGIGGHSNSAGETTVTIDGELITTRWWDGSSPPNTWHSAVNYPNTGDKHTVEVTFTPDRVATDNSIYIQPNRYLGNYNVHALDYTVEVYNLELFVHD